MIGEDNQTERLIDMQIIQDLVSGNGFPHYKRRFIKTKTLTKSDEDLQRIYHSRSELDMVVKKLVSYCPTISTFVPREPLDKRKKSVKIAQKKAIDKFLKKIQWTSKLNNIYSDLELKGDVFYYMYFPNKDSKEPMFKYLEPKSMVDIILDSDGKPSAYKYVETYVETDISEQGDFITKYIGEVIYIFTKGKTEVYKQTFDLNDKTGKYEPSKDKYNKQIYSKKVYPNRPSYIDDIPIVRIPSYLKDGEKFSNIPASKYIEHALTLDDLNSNIKFINMMLGYPVVFIVNGRMVNGEWMPGGVIYVDNKQPNDQDGGYDGLKSEAKVQDLQISNDLASLFKYYSDEDDALRESAGLISKTLQLKLGSSDSSRVIQQLIAPMNNKIELYVDNILEAMEMPIRVVLKENGLWEEERDNGITLYKPPFIVKVSPFDEQIFDQNEINSGAKTKTEIGLQKGQSFEEIEGRIGTLMETVDSNAESSAQVRSANNM